ncbi:Putative secreted protein ARB-04696-like protein [Acrodontium crateriforme]|uniref:Secreted protein ARB-04696-like protein n=1 Tax=Acrodontium crateriforme TaxID=150365 RepID=A0AAQ3LXT6_9PEZI|nr:Putative secreted protein ARB-04696-like protein [Acrodontium crateriforme]
MRFLVASSASVLAFSSTLASALTLPYPFGPAVNETKCNGKDYVYEELTGYGYVPNDARDKFGDTIGGFGSAIAIDRSSWINYGLFYKGILWGLPDRGWNTEGTLNYQNRLHKFEITLTPNPFATADQPGNPNLQFKYLDSILLTDPTGTPTCGLDADIKGPYKTFPGIPVDIPSAHYTGDGFGGDGPGGYRVVIDSEGLFLGHDGSFWISDEYGPYVYHFDKSGKMIGAIRPPDAIVPLRNNSESFSADSPPRYDPSLAPIPADNPTGRDNNQGFEGLTVNPQGTKLYTLLQSATNQDGGLQKNRYTGNSRLVVYDITTAQPTYEAEYVVQLAHTVPNDTTTKVARQSEIHYVSDTQFMILAHDNDAGAGQADTESIYRHVDIFDISNATNVKGATHDCSTCQIASSSKGVLNSDITPAQYCSWLDFNVNSQLNKFGAHNGGAMDSGLLNEKWESLALVPVHPLLSAFWPGDQEYFLFAMSDNDFITQNGYINFGKLPYKDASGYNLNNQALVFKVKLPANSKPLVS